MNKQNKLLFCIILILSVLTGILRMLLYRFAMDDKQLLTSGHPLELAVWILTLCAVVAAVMLSRRNPELSVGKSTPVLCAAGSWILAIGLVLSPNPTGLIQMQKLIVVNRVLSWAAAAALAAIGLFQLRGKKPVFGLHALVCLFFTIHMVTRYQGWSSNPALQDYVFSLLGCIAMSLFAYHQAALEIGLGQQVRRILFGLLGVYFCCAAVVNSEYGILYVSGALWMLTNLSLPYPQSSPEKEA